MAGENTMGLGERGMEAGGPDGRLLHPSTDYDWEEFLNAQFWTAIEEKQFQGKRQSFKYEWENAP